MSMIPRKGDKIVKTGQPTADSEIYLFAEANTNPESGITYWEYITEDRARRFKDYSVNFQLWTEEWERERDRAIESRTDRR